MHCVGKGWLAMRALGLASIGPVWAEALWRPIRGGRCEDDLQLGGVVLAGWAGSIRPHPLRMFALKRMKQKGREIALGELP